MGLNIRDIEGNKVKYGVLDVLFLILMTITTYFTRNIACQVMMVIFGGSVCVNILMEGTNKTKTAYFWGTVIFIAYGLWGAFYGPKLLEQKVALTMVGSITINLVMVYLICQYILWLKDVDDVLKIFELAVFITAVITILMMGGNIFSGRLGMGTQINANVLAMLSVYSMVVCIYFMKKSKRKLMYSLKILFYIAVVLLSGSRKGLLMIGISILLINVVFGKKNLIRNVFVAAVAIAAIYFMVMKIPMLYNIIGVRVEDLLSLVFEDSTQDGSLITRQALIETGWKCIGRNPWFGYGYDTFKLVSGIVGTQSGDYGLYSHNNYVELLFGGGIIGTTLYYIPMVAILVGLIRNLKTHACIPYLLAIFVAKHVIEYGYVSYYSRIDAYVVAVILGCLLWCRNNKPGEEKEDENALNKETA